jgi:hypothetical protein
VRKGWRWRMDWSEEIEGRSRAAAGVSKRRTLVFEEGGAGA